jgi:hypothetical protein
LNVFAENDRRWADLIKLFQSQAVRHPDQRAKTLKALDLLSKYKMYYHDELTSDTLIQPGDEWSFNDFKFELSDIWADVLATPIEELDVADRGALAKGQFSMGKYRLPERIKILTFNFSRNYEQFYSKRT